MRWADGFPQDIRAQLDFAPVHELREVDAHLSKPWVSAITEGERESALNSSEEWWRRKSERRAGRRRPRKIGCQVARSGKAGRPEDGVRFEKRQGKRDVLPGAFFHLCSDGFG